MSMEALLSPVFWEPFILTLKLAFLTTVCLFLVGIPIAYALVFAKMRYKPLYEAAIAMPLVLPPSVLGFYFLLAFSKNGFLGSFWNDIFGHQLAFHFDGLVIGSIIFSFPFMVHPLMNGFKNIDTFQIEAAYTMGKSKLQTLFAVMLPAMKPSLITGGIISFAHTVGEFGVVLMIGGNIDGETKVASIAIYNEVEALNYSAAHAYSLILFAFSFFVLWLVYQKLGQEVKGSFNA